MLRVRYIGFPAVLMLFMVIIFSGCKRPVSIAEEIYNITSRDGVAVEEEKFSKEEKKKIRELSKRIRKIEKDLNRQVRWRIEESEAYTALGLVLMENGMYAHANQTFTTAILLVGNNAMLHYYRGYCAEQAMRDTAVSGDRLVLKDEAVRDYLRTLEIQPKHDLALYRLALIRGVEEERYADAVLLLDEYFRVIGLVNKRKGLLPRETAALFLRARSSYALGLTADAVEHYDKIINYSTDEEVRKKAADLKRQVLSAAGRS